MPVIPPTAFVCTNCGTQYAPSATPPDACAICRDERQYVNRLGQSWTTQAALRRTHMNAWRCYEPDLFGIGTVPAFGTGHRALLLRTPSGNVLWDCITLLDDATEALVRALGGVATIAISHPHYYTAMVDWARAFGAPVLLHAADRAHVMHPDPAVAYWSGDQRVLGPGVTLVRLGGHFAGATVLHWAAGAGGAGALLSGDIVQVGPDDQVSFMRSYPNLIPLDAASVRRMAAALDPFAFAAIYGAWWDRYVLDDGKAVLHLGVRRYLAALAGPPDAAQDQTAVSRSTP